MESSGVEEDWDPVGAQEYAALLTAVFGDSDTDEDSTDQHYCAEDKVDIESDDEYVWDQVEEVEGLWHCSKFLSIKQQQCLLEAIESEGWFCDHLHNQAMRFGDLPGWAQDLSILIQRRSGGQNRLEGLEHQNSDQCSEIDGPDEFREITSPFPFRILERDPFFDQMIVNMYQPGEGISAHVDLLRFEDGIAVVSLESACVMSFRPVSKSLNGVEDTRTKPALDPHHHSSPGYGNFANTKEMPSSRSLLCRQLYSSGTIPQARPDKSQSFTCELDPESGSVKRVDVLLNPGDLITASGPARYNWTHEINRSKGNQVWKEQPIVQQRRVSVTLRRLCPQKDV
ncbi:unnamed protein product [Calypogeia fissa]